MINVYIIIAFTFTLGNLLWWRIGDERLYYIPLSLLLLSGALIAKLPKKKLSVRQEIFTDWICLMAAGNVVKQIFYNSSDIAELNDIYWGLFLAVFFIPKVIHPKIYLKLSKFIKTKWAIILTALKKLLKHG